MLRAPPLPSGPPWPAGFARICRGAAGPGRTGRPGGLRAGVDRRLRRALGPGGGHRGRADRAVGDSAEHRPAGGAGHPGARQWRGMVVPGFMDGHTHFIYGGFQLTSVDLRDADLARRSSSPGSRPTRPRLKPRRMDPRRRLGPRALARHAAPGAELDRFGDAEQSGVRQPAGRSHGSGQQRSRCGGPASPDTTKDIPGGVIVRRPDRRADRHAQGRGQGSGASPSIPTPIPGAERRSPRRAMRWAASKGVTAVADVSVPWFDVAAPTAGPDRGTLTTRVSLYFPLQDWRRMADTVRANGVGDDWLRMAGSRDTWTDRSAPRPPCSTSRTTTTPRPAGLLVTPEDSLRAWIGSGRFRRPPGGGARHRRAGQRPAARHLRQRGPGARRRATGASGSSTRSTCAARTSAGSPERGDRLDAALPRDRRRPLGGEADRTRAHQDHLRLPLPARRGRAPRLRLRLDRRSASTRILGSMPRSPAAPSTARIPDGWVPEERSRWKRRCGPTPAAMPTASLPSGAAASWLRATWPIWCCSTRT